MDEMATPSQKQIEETVEKNVSIFSDKPILQTTEVAGTEHRQAYGTAKTENLRDSGAWRIILPAFVGLLCLSLFAVPMIILVNLLVGSLDPNAATHSLTWFWITMIVLSLCIAAVISWGLVRIFMTQAGNYRSAA